MNDFNKLIKNKKAKMLNFPGASSRQDGLWKLETEILV